MRKIALLAAAALLVPLGVVASQMSASAVGGTSCSHAAGSASFAPGLYKIQPAAMKETHESAQTITSSGGTVSGCVGGGITSGTTTSTIHIVDPTNCDSLTDSSEPPASPPTTGNLTIKWNNTKTSVIPTLTLSSVPGQITEAKLSGKISATSAMFPNLTFTGTIKYTPKTGNCVSTNLTAVTYANVGNTTIH